MGEKGSVDGEMESLFVKHSQGLRFSKEFHVVPLKLNWSQQAQLGSSADLS